MVDFKMFSIYLFINELCQGSTQIQLIGISFMIHHHYFCMCKLWLTVTISKKQKQHCLVKTSIFLNFAKYKNIIIYQKI